MYSYAQSTRALYQQIHVNDLLENWGEEAERERPVTFATHYYMKRNPVWCGIMVFWMQITIYRVGMEIANATRVVFSVLHFYNMAVHEASSPVQIPDLDYLIDLIDPSISSLAAGRPKPASMSNDMTSPIVCHCECLPLHLYGSTNRSGRLVARAPEDYYDRML